MRIDAVSPLGTVLDPLLSQDSRYDASRFGRRCRDGSASVRHKEQVLGLGETIRLTSHRGNSVVGHQHSVRGLRSRCLRLLPRIFHRLVALDSCHVSSKFSPVLVFLC